MEYIFYDTETTGLTRKDEVIQFAGFVSDEKLKLKSLVSFYCYTQVPISSSAKKVHGISAGALWKLSKGMSFEDQFYESSLVRKKDLTWVSYSANGFDERVVNQTLKNNGLKEYDFGSKVTYLGQESKGVHTFKLYSALKNRCFGGKDKRLEQAALESGISVESVEECLERIVGGARKQSFHDAVFDAFAMYLLVLKNKRKLGLIEL